MGYIVPQLVIKMLFINKTLENCKRQLSRVFKQFWVQCTLFFLKIDDGSFQPVLLDLPDLDQ